VDQFAVLMGKQGASTDYYLHPTAYDVWRRSGGQGDLPTPGRNAVLVPAHILSDHDYPLRVNPNGLASAKGTCSMDAKTAKYTVAGTKLAQDEMNDRARAFTSGFVDGPWRHLDENTVKWHYGDPEVDAMYRYTQERSRLLADRGASLVRSDIDAARTGAGERPWSKVSLQAAPVGGAA
jgi:hypothetical protein